MEKTLAYYVTVLRKDFKEYCSSELQKLGLTQGLFFFILYIGKHPNCSPSELSERLHMDAGHTNRTLTKLENSGFVLQDVNPDDRRAHILKLTKQGEEAFKIGHNLFSAWDNHILKDFSKKEKQDFLQTLDSLLKEGDHYVQPNMQPLNHRKCNIKK
ncbi:bilirubin utilization transcriptional regulator BilQ [Anaerorhabdus furcosa]|uniref:DNA-binding transcriptional regulator, MarR family n=1 Tax=Anaerorhabdus furcosa TaxID=118967 RepID=A0A1T4LAE6_9FIRM|nr:bilirubin utilization transcriptional regulator BilQ [Anaerorhabdus furcosa]SJZ51590.1 DNA-binding transcriptional regulator, MarR family [Anaerorhabdus furcosa]